MRLRIARSLVFLQGTVLVLAAMFVVAVSALFGAGNSVPFAGVTLSGGGAVALGAVYAALAIACLWLGIALGRMAPWSRPGIVGLEILLGVLFAIHGALSVTTAISLLLCAAVVALILSTPAHR